jgi:hypothetical protein
MDVSRMTTFWPEAVLDSKAHGPANNQPDIKNKLDPLCMAA